MYDDEHNHTCICKTIEFVRNHGPTHLPATAASINTISDADLLGRMQDKFKLMKKQYHDRQRLVAAAEAVVVAKNTLTPTTTPETGDPENTTPKTPYHS
jgi:hypothetical protein